MLPFKTMISVDRTSRTPIYLQITNAIIQQTNFGSIPSGYKLPGTRKMAAILGLNRRTVTLAYEELESQGWLDIKPHSGCYISEDLPRLHPRAFNIDDNVNDQSDHTFEIDDKYHFLSHFESVGSKGDTLTIDAGYPDIRLSPLVSLSRNFNTILNGHHTKSLMSYTTNFEGDDQLRKELAVHLKNTRSINVNIDNIMITRGSLMAFYLIFQVILNTDDKVIVASPGFHVANNIIQIAGGQLIKVPIDKDGIDVDAIGRICQKTKIRAVFIMPHHHNPTTVSLCAERRMKLLSLASKYRLAVIEDDYDYDFHYDSAPILPMASSDRYGNVIYVGSLSKTIAPGLRLGYIVASQEMIRNISRLSRVLDCHGNNALERSVAMLFNQGEIVRYLKKTLKIYKDRRDKFCTLLNEKLGDYVSFDQPEGGMAVWVNFNPDIHIRDLRIKAATKGMITSKAIFRDIHGSPINAMRMGFASLNEKEAHQAISILYDILHG